MNVTALIAALAEVKAICARRTSCHGCPFDLTGGCLARAKHMEPDVDDYPMYWAVEPAGRTHERA